MTCGTSVSGDLLLEHDLECSPGFTGNALTVTADGITIDGVTGTFDLEKEASPIIFDGNPAREISVLWNVDEVCLAGERIDRGPVSFVAQIRQDPTVSRPEAKMTAFAAAK